MWLVPYLAEISAGVGTLRDCSRRLPGFTGPIPSTALDKAIQLLQAIVGPGEGGCQASVGISLVHDSSAGTLLEMPARCRISVENGFGNRLRPLSRFL